MPPPTPAFGSEGRGTLAGERGGGRVSIPTRRHTLWYSIYMYFVEQPLTGDRGQDKDCSLEKEHQYQQLALFVYLIKEPLGGRMRRDEKI